MIIEKGDNWRVIPKRKSLKNKLMENLDKAFSDVDVFPKRYELNVLSSPRPCSCWYRFKLGVQYGGFLGESEFLDNRLRIRGSILSYSHNICFKTFTTKLPSVQLWCINSRTFNEVLCSVTLHNCI